MCVLRNYWLKALLNRSSALFFEAAESLFEGFGISFIEAAQYGIPSIGGKDGGASDAIVHNKTGLICDGNSLDDIYSSIDNLFVGNKYIEFGKECKTHSENFLWDKIIENYKRIL